MYRGYTRKIIFAVMIIALLSLIILVTRDTGSDRSDPAGVIPQTSQEVAVRYAPDSFFGHPALNRRHPPLDMREVEKWCLTGCDYAGPWENGVYLIASASCEATVNIPIEIRPMGGNEDLILQHTFKALEIPTFSEDEFVFTALCGLLLWVDGPLPMG